MIKPVRSLLFLLMVLCLSASVFVTLSAFSVGEFNQGMMRLQLGVIVLGAGLVSFIFWAAIDDLADIFVSVRRKG